MISLKYYYVKYITVYVCRLLWLTGLTIKCYFMGFMTEGLTLTVNPESLINLINVFSYFYFRQLIQLLYETEIIVNPFDIWTAAFQHLSILLFIMTLFNDYLVIFPLCFSQLTWINFFRSDFMSHYMRCFTKIFTEYHIIHFFAYWILEFLMHRFSCTCLLIVHLWLISHFQTETKKNKKNNTIHINFKHSNKIIK